MPEPKVRQAVRGDAINVRKIDHLTWPENLWLKDKDFQFYFESYLEGQFVVECGDRVVGCLFTQRLDNESTLLDDGKTSSDFTSLHQGEGKVIQLIRISVLPQYEGLGLSHALIEGSLEHLKKQQGSIEKVVAVTRCSQFKAAGAYPYDDYVYSGRDPTIAFHVGRGAEVVKILHNFRLEDTQNDGHGVLIRYSLKTNTDSNFDQSTSQLQFSRDDAESRIKDAVRRIAQSSEEPALDEPLIEYGLDSIDFSGLKASLENIFSISLEATFLFSYPTVQQIAAYVVDQNKNTGSKAKALEVELPDGSLTKRSPNYSEAIWIIDTAERLPAAIEVGGFKEAVSHVPLNRWDPTGFEEVIAQQSGVTSGSFGIFLHLHECDIHGISQKEALQTDPQQLLIIENAQNLKRASCPKHDGEIGVAAAVSNFDFAVLQQKIKPVESQTHSTLIGSDLSVCCGKVSYLLNFNGPSYVVNTACSSSLVATNAAMHCLRNFECQLHFVLSASTILSPHVMVAYAKMGMLSIDGRCQSFDQQANGYVRAEASVGVNLGMASGSGVAIVASSVQQDGRSAGLTAPNGIAQQKLLLRTSMDADVPLSDIQHQEMHATGTPLGDPIEYQAFKQALRSSSHEMGFIISVSGTKAIAGHGEPCAGLSSTLRIIKSSLKAKKIVNNRLRSMNKHFGPDMMGSNLIFPTVNGSAALSSSYAGINSFAFQGTIARLLLKFDKGNERPATRKALCKKLISCKCVSYCSSKVLVSSGSKKLCLHLKPKFGQFTIEGKRVLTFAQMYSYLQIGYNDLCQETTKQKAVTADMVQTRVMHIDYRQHQMMQCTVDTVTGQVELQSQAEGKSHKTWNLQAIWKKPVKHLPERQTTHQDQNEWNKGIMGIMHHNQAAHTANAIATVAKTSNDLYDYTVNPAVGDANLQLGAVESVIRLASQDNASQETQVPTGCHAYYMGDQSDAPAAYTAVCQNGSQAGISSHRLKSLCEEINCASVLNLQTKAAFKLQSALNAANSQQKVQEKDMLLSALVWSACYATPLDCAAHQNAIIAGSRDAQENVLLVKLGDAQSNLEHPLKIACRNAGALYSSSHVDSPEMQEYLTNTSKSVHVVCLVSHQANVAKQLVGLANLVKAVNKSNMESPSITVVFLDSQTTMNVQHNTSKALWGACRTMRMEYPSLQLTTIQMDAHMDKSQAALYLLSEIQNKHSTEKEVMYKNATRYINTIVEKYPSASQHLSLNPHLEKLQRGSYVITGGLGGLGLVTAQLLADMGATSISLLSRSGIIQRTDQNLNAILDKVREKANVEVIACDVSKEDHVRNLYTKQNHPCVGIIHAAGVLRDGLAANLNHTQVQQVFDPKISGALHLHHNTLLQPLQVCIMFSSIVSLYGNIGQTSYSAANTYLDTLAALRQNQGLPAVSIQWPAISGIGMWEGLSSVHKKTFEFNLPVKAVISCLQNLVSKKSFTITTVTILPRWMIYGTREKNKAHMAAKADPNEIQRQPTSGRSQSVKFTSVAVLTSQVQNTIEQAVIDTIGETIDTESPLMEAGVDSLASSELINKINDDMGTSLGPTILFDYPTIQDLTQHLVQTLKGPDATDHAIEAVERIPNHDPMHAVTTTMLSSAIRYPNHTNSNQRFLNVLNNQSELCSVTPLQRWDRMDWYSSQGYGNDIYVPFGYWLPDLWTFQPDALSMTSAESLYVDPQGRKLLEVTWEAMYNTPLSSNKHARTNTGVYVGCCQQDFQKNIHHMTDPGKQILASISFLCGRVSYVMGFKGPCISIDTACSSSLAATHLGRTAIIAHECDTATIAGTNIMIAPQTTQAICNLQALAVDGRCKTLDATANGYGRAEAIAAVIIANANDTHTNMLKMPVNIVASFVNQDGRSSSLTAPNGPSQSTLISSALRQANLKPEQINHVVMHGTGTPLGDPIEVGALGQAFHSDDKVHMLALAAVKVAFGHTEGAAGLTGLLSAMQSCSTLCIQPVTACRNMNVHVQGAIKDHRDGHKRVTSARIQQGPWSFTCDENNDKAIAGTSSFGMSGVNSHGVVEAKLAGHTYNAQSIAWNNKQVLFPMVGCAFVKASYKASTKQHQVFAIQIKDHNLLDHMVMGKSILPGAGFMELSSASARAMLNPNVLRDLKPVLAKISIPAPMQLEPNKHQMMQCTVDTVTGQVGLKSHKTWNLQAIWKKPVKHLPERQTTHQDQNEWNKGIMGIMHHNQAAHTANAIATVAKTSNDLYDYTVNPAVGDANLQLGAVESVIRLASQDNASQETQVPTGCHAYYMGDQSDAPAAYTAVCQNGSQAGISSHRLKSLCEEINCASVLNLQTKAAFKLQSALNAANSQQKVQEKDMLLSALVWSACYATPLDCAAHQNAIIAGSRDAQENVLLVKLGDAQSNLEHPLKIACRNAGALYSSSHVDSPEMQEYLTNTSKSVHVVCLVSHQANVAKQLVGLANLVKAVNKSNMESPSITVVFLDSQTTMNVQHNTSKALWGACRTMRMEYPSLQLTTIQMDAHMDKSQAALYLLSEIQNKHSTEKEVMYKNATRYINTIVEKYPSASQHLSLNPHLEKLQRGSYVITGGLGGLGLVTAQLLADMGATSISLLSRSGIIQRTDQNLNAILDKVREKANVEVIACDVSKEDHVRNLYTKQNHPCVGIIHAAGVLRDGLAANLNHTQVQQVFDPKISGALHLHHNTLLQPLQVCIMFSSIASLYGNIGQTSYSAANTYLDTLAALRQNQGLPAVSIQWPAISGIGMWEGLSSVHKKTTPFTLSVEGAITSLNKILKDLSSFTITTVTILPRWMIYGTREKNKAHMAAKADPNEIQRQPTSGRSQSVKFTSVAVLTSQVQNTIEQAVIDTIGETIDTESPLMEAGVDSLASSELINKINDDMGTSLGPTILFDYPTIQDLTQHLVQTLKGPDATDHAIEAVERIPNHDPMHAVTTTMLSSAIRYPNHTNSNQRFLNVLNNQSELCAVTPLQRWDRMDWYSSQGYGNDIYVPFGYWLPDLWTFQPDALSMTSAESLYVDPQGRKLLEVTWEAMYNTPLSSNKHARTNTGVYVGCMYTEYPHILKGANMANNAGTGTGSGISFLCGRVSYVMGFKGPCISIDTACSSSLAATHLGRTAIIAHECDTATIAGTNIMIAPQTTQAICNLQALAVDGRCKTLDATANGYGRAEAIAAVIIANANDTYTNMLKMPVNIVASFVNQDGRSSSLTAPNGPSQSTLISSALRQANLKPEQINHVVMHGTGTPLGDPIEVGALGQAFHSDDKVHMLALAAVKVAFGHTEGAAGLTGLLSAMQSCSTLCIQPVTACRNMNVHVQGAIKDHRDGHKRVTSARIQQGPWSFTCDENNDKAIAGTSSFGMSGVNSHGVVEAKLAGHTYNAQSIAWNNSKYSSQWLGVHL
ncbi:polyketide synthase [Chloropicon primus]|uniref:Polyketide synthase n=2 Tax=Chloropicon primus TaxID=1764295 RepID=A0A5B8MPL7_9CHLO|nr:polyketide synthase [Chloropicon primus]|eukprot:QDZ21994.1 polyketide synthase [Chloropicon primus]